MRKNATSEYFYRLKKILKTNLSAKNKISAINQLAVPVLQYTFGVVDWPQNSLDPVDVKTRKYLTMYKIFYKLQNHDRLYLPRVEGGMGLTNINNSHRATIVSMYKYLTTSTKDNIKTIVQHELSKQQNTSIIKLGRNFIQQYEVEND